MAEIPDLTAGSTPDAAVFHGVEGGNSRKFTGSEIAGSAHTHAQADITDLVADLAAKLDDSQAGAGGLSVLSAANAAAVRAAAGTVIGTDVQAFDAQLTDLAGLSYGGNALKVVRVNAGETSFELASSGAGTGDVVGPGSSVAGHVALFDGTTGKLLKDSAVAVMANGATITPTATPATNEVGYLGAPQNLGLDSGNVTLALTDCGKHVYHTDANARDLTIPANGSIAFPIGTVIAGVNENGAGVVTLKITTDTLRWGSSTGQRTIAANAAFSLLKVAATVWRLTGDGIT